MANQITIEVVGRDGGAKQTITATSREADKLGGSVKRVGEIAQGIIAAQMFERIGQGAQRFLSGARTASSDLGESLNAVNVTFKDSAAGILEIGKTADSSMGLSRNAFNAAAVRFSAFAEAVAGPGGDVTRVIRDITQRSSDFASVMNLDVNEAMQTFQSGLAGESEPLRRYGIDVSAAAVQTFAYANGIAEAGAELTEAQKIQARYGLIMEQTSDAAGDFANTSDSLANSQRILAAEMENAQAITGNLMLPALAAMNNLLIPMVQAFSDAPKPIQIVVGSLVLLGAGILTVTSRIAPMIIAMQTAGISAGTMAAKFRAVALSATAMSAGIAAAGAGIIAWGQSARHTQGDVEGLSDDIERLAQTGEATAQLKSMFGEGAAGAEEFKDKLDVATAGFFDWSDSLNRSFDETSKAKSAFEDLDQALAAMVDQGADADDLMRLLTESFGLNEEQVEKLKEVLPEYAEAAERAAGATGQEADAHDAATGAIEEHVDALETLANKLKEQTDPLFAFIGAQQRAEEAQIALTEAEDKFGKNSPEYNAALLDLAEANLDLFAATTDASGKIDGSLIPSLRRARDAGIITDEQFDALVGTIKEVDRTDARITVRDNTAQAKARFRTMQRQLKNINRFVTYSFRTQGAAPVGSSNVAFAHGGITGAQGGGPRGRTTLVGEQGPELVDLAPGSFVHPAGQTRAMLQEAREGLAALRGGRTFFEDFSFRGGGRERFNSLFADRFYDSGGRFNRREVTRFLQKMVEELEDRLRPPRRAVAPRAPAASVQTDAGVVSVELIIKGDGSRRAEQTIADVRQGLLVNATFRREIAAVRA